MHRVLPGCTYGSIPKVQGALDVHYSLAVNMAGTLATFLVEVNVEREGLTPRFGCRASLGMKIKREASHG